MAAVLKTAGCNSSGGSNPSSPAEVLMTIIVNNDPVTTHRSALSYEEIVIMAYGQSAAGRVLSMVYKTKPSESSDSMRQGTMWPGRKISIEDGMIFTVMDTGNA
jgi:hypothetical protein